jgi:hypothetical protein
MQTKRTLGFTEVGSEGVIMAMKVYLDYESVVNVKLSSLLN